MQEDQISLKIRLQSEPGLEWRRGSHLSLNETFWAGVKISDLFLQICVNSHGAWPGVTSVPKKRVEFLCFSAFERKERNLMHWTVQRKQISFSLKHKIDLFAQIQAFFAQETEILWKYNARGCKIHSSILRKCLSMCCHKVGEEKVIAVLTKDLKKCTCSCFETTFFSPLFCGNGSECW